MTASTVQLMTFFSYRSYLAALFAAEKELNRAVTLNKMGQSFGISGAMFQMIIDGKRNISNTLMVKIIQRLRLNTVEASYFESIVFSENAVSSEEKKYFEKKAKQIRKQSKLAAVELPSSALLAKWFIPAVLVYFLDRHDLDVDADSPDTLKAIAKAVGASVEHIQITVSQLMNMKILEMAKEGRVHVRFDRLSSTLAQKQYLLDVMTESNERIRRDFQNDECYFVSNTLSIKKGDISYFIEEYKKLMDKFMALEILPDERKEVRVMQTGFQMFPVF